MSRAIFPSSEEVSRGGARLMVRQRDRAGQRASRAFSAGIVTCLLVIFSSQLTHAQDMPLSQVLIPGEEWQELGRGYRFTEGPAADAKGNVYFTDIPNHRIHRIDLSGKITLFAEQTAGANGLMFGPDGRLYACRNGEKKIVAYHPNGKFDVVAEGIPSNDLVVSSRGDLFVTDPSAGKIWHVTAQGKKNVVAEGLKPNGVILTADEGTLVVTDGEAPHLWAFRVEADGKLTHRERYFMPLQLLSGRKRPGSDGMTVDDDRRVYVATSAGIQMFDPTGRLGGTIANPQAKFTSNVVFGGPGFRYLYATSSDKVYRRKVLPSGTPYFLRDHSSAARP